MLLRSPDAQKSECDIVYSTDAILQMQEMLFIYTNPSADRQYVNEASTNYDWALGGDSSLVKLLNSS